MWIQNCHRNVSFAQSNAGWNRKIATRKGFEKMEMLLYNSRFIGYNKCVGNMHPTKNIYD